MQLIAFCLSLIWNGTSRLRCSCCSWTKRLSEVHSNQHLSHKELSWENYYRLRWHHTESYYQNQTSDPNQKIILSDYFYLIMKFLFHVQMSRAFLNLTHFFLNLYRQTVLRKRKTYDINGHPFSPMQWDCIGGNGRSQLNKGLNHKLEALLGGHNLIYLYIQVIQQQSFFNFLQWQ